ncbi:unnamed protein product [Phaeothamnion confervicola]
MQLDEAMEEHEVREALADLDVCLQTESALQVLLGALLPEARGGVYLISVALLHTDQRTRHSALNLLQRMEQFDSTRPAVQSMSDFMRMAYIRQQPPGPS